MKIISCLSCLVLGFAASTSANAQFPCVIAAETAEAAVSISGKTLTPPLRLPSCDGVHVIKGSIVACFTRTGGQKTCKAINTGESLDAVQLQAAGFQKNSDFGFISMLKGDTQVRTGQTRAASLNVAGMPHGEILGLERTFTLGIYDKRITFPAEVQIVTDDSVQTIITKGQLPTQGSIEIPASFLHPGGAYRWIIAMEGGNLKGRFTVAPLTTQQEMKDRIESLLSDISLSETGKAMLLADLFNEHGYAYDRDKVLSRLK